MRRRKRARTRPSKVSAAFTLIELLIVMVIIGIIIAFILTAAQGGVRRAEERATQALVTKLEAGLSDRIDALIAERADANMAHAYLADVISSSLAVNTTVQPTAGLGLTDSPNNTRAQVIARIELLKSELPDVFVVQNDPNYPLNFLALPYPGTPAVTGTAYDNFMLPMGVGVANSPVNGSYGANSGVAAESTGIFGATYSVAGGLYKNLVAEAVKQGQAQGVKPPVPFDRGYNGIDDDQSGLVDNLTENDNAPQAGMKVSAYITGTLLPKHTHKTARAEMLYALLVEGQGPLGSVFNRDEFSDREVRDTDGDGLPEFVDAWGEPLQFYRWPVGFVDDSQRGFQTYGSPPSGDPFMTRQQNPLDPNQSLLDPFWWSGKAIGSYAANDSSIYIAPGTVSPLSGSAYLFQSLFGLLTDPNAGVISTALWDRGSAWPARRAYSSRFLVLSGGPDKTPGVPVFDTDYYQNLSSFTPATVTGPSYSGASPVAVPTSIAPGNSSTQTILYLQIEGQAAQATFSRTNFITYTLKDTNGTPILFPNYPSLTTVDPVSQGIREAGNDDVTNHNLQAPGGATQ